MQKQTASKQVIVECPHVWSIDAIDNNWQNPFYVCQRRQSSTIYKYLLDAVGLDFSFMWSEGQF